MKTPKEKAVELVNQYIQVKRGALIAVDEIIKFGNEQGIREPMMYWQSVKQEIIKL